MAKRFIDSNIFKKGFMKNLPAQVKLFYIYLICECDHYGIWSVELDVAEVRLGITLENYDVRGMLHGRIVEIDNGTKWFIPQFISFQYGTLNEKHKLHKSVIRELTARNLYQYLTLTEHLPNTYITAKDKDKDKDKDRDKDRDKDKDSEAGSENRVESTHMEGNSLKLHTVTYENVSISDSGAEPTVPERSSESLKMRNKAIGKAKKSGSEGSKQAIGEQYSTFVEVYKQWVEERSIPFRFTPADGKALKQIITYLSTVDTVKSGNKSPLELWQFILSKWSILSSWMQSQVQVRQINSQLPNIIEQIKQNYNGTKQQPNNKQQSAVSEFAQQLRNAIKGN